MSVALSIVEGRASAEEWDDFVRQQSGSTLCHRHGWRDVIGGTFGHECLWLEARSDDGGLQGVLPLVRVKSRLFGHYLVSVPFLNYGGPVGSDAAVRALASEAVERARTEHVRLLELRSRIELPLDLAVSRRKVTVVLDLPGASEPLMKGFPAKLRSQVRRPFKAGLEVRFGVSELGPFFEVFSRHMRDLGTPVMPRRFFAEAVRTFGEDVWVGCAYLDHKPVACGFGFVWEGEFEMTWASALSEYNRVSVNMGLYWSFMERAIEHGLPRFNFGRCSPDGGTHRFKRQWGSRDEPLWWYQAAENPGRAATPAPDQGAYSWGPRLWKRLPLGIANRLGPRIVRSIP